jgi:hypothetical protein
MAENWATELTLSRLYDVSKESKALLEKIAGTKLDATSDPVRAEAKKTAKELSLFGRVTSSVAKKTKDDFNEALTDLRGSVRYFSRDLRSPDLYKGLTTGFAQGGQRLGSLLENFSDRVSGLAASFPVVGPVVGGVIGAFTGVIQQLFATREAFITLNQSGILFGGSLARYNQALGDAGLSSEQFAAIAQQSGSAIRLFGETRFLQTTTNLRDSFLNLGLTIQQGNEYFAEYLENSRLVGNLYMSTREQEQAAFERTIKQQQELAILTGATVTEQRRAARERAASAQYRAMMMALPEPERRRLEGVATSMAAAGMDQKTIEAAIMQSAFGRTLPEYSRMLSLLPGEMRDTISQFVQTGTAENQRAFIETLSQQATALRASPQMQTLVQLVAGGSLEGAATSIINLLTQVQNAGRPTPEQEEALRKLNERNRVIDDNTRAIGSASEAIARTLGAIQSEINKFTEANLLPPFTDVMDRVRDAIGALTRAGEGEGFRALAQFMGAGEAGTRIAAAFDRSLLSGFGETLKTILMAPINYLMEKLEKWKDEFIEGLRSLIPSWLRPSAPRAPDNTTGLAEQTAQPQIVVPTNILPAERLREVAIPAPPVQINQPDIVTPEQFAAIRQREQEVGRLAGELLNMRRRTQEQEDRLIQLQEQQNQYLERMMRAQIQMAQN